MLDPDESEAPSIGENSPEHMGLATSHHAFPLCPAKLIQESLTSSDSICRQEHKCFLKYTICAHWSSYGGNCFSLVAFVYAEVYIWQEVTLHACFRSCSVFWWDFFFLYPIWNLSPNLTDLSMARF